MRKRGGSGLHKFNDEGMRYGRRDANLWGPMLTIRHHRNHFVNSKEGRALYGDEE